MAHVLDGTGIDPVLFSTIALERARTRVALLPRIYTESRPRPKEGGNRFYVYPPAPVVDPADFDSATDLTDDTPTSEITREPIAVQFNRHKIHRVSWDLFESRLAIGNFEAAWNWAFKGYVDGMVRTIERDIAAQYANAAYSVGSSAVALTDANIRLAILELTKQNIDPMEDGDVSFVTTPNAWWTDLFGEDRYARYDAAGDKAINGAIRGKLLEAYGLNWNYSPNIVGSYGSGGATSHNMLFHKDALGISFNLYESVSKYVGEAGQNVEEDITTDPETNITFRTQIYYDVKKKKFFIEMDCEWVAYTMVSGYLIDVRSQSGG
jgi:hypothetical protein